MQLPITLVLDPMWSGATAGGVRVYDFNAYRAGLSPMLLWLAVARACLLLTRETGCRQFAERPLS
ncbi:MAG: hypothetical protein EXR27_11520 [Betaproteobacteria bacterium]|nr:hypothetical protein [Betaproteobacteria bacterium]